MVHRDFLIQCPRGQKAILFFSLNCTYTNLFSTLSNFSTAEGKGNTCNTGSSLLFHQSRPCDVKSLKKSWLYKHTIQGSGHCIVCLKKGVPWRQDMVTEKQSYAPDGLSMCTVFWGHWQVEEALETSRLLKIKMRWISERLSVRLRPWSSSEFSGRLHNFLCSIRLMFGATESLGQELQFLLILQHLKKKKSSVAQITIIIFCKWGR